MVYTISIQYMHAQRILKGKHMILHYAHVCMQYMHLIPTLLFIVYTHSSQTLGYYSYL